MEKPKCKYSHVCGLLAEADPENGLCILHARAPNKDYRAFDDALERHCSGKSDDFAYFVFPKPVSFQGYEFVERAIFRRAIFIGEAYFGGESHHEVKLYSFLGATFKKEADFRDARFQKAADFSGANFYAVANFNSAEFSEKVDFRHARFSEDAHYYGTTFSKDANFNEARFSKRGDFIRSRFTGEVLFSDTQFSKRANFNNTEFSRDAHFYRTRFPKETYFSDCSFLRGAYFNGAQFTEGALFWRTIFRGYVGFSHSSVLGKTIFSGSGSTIPFGGKRGVHGVEKDIQLFSRSERAREIDRKLEKTRFYQFRERKELRRQLEREGSPVEVDFRDVNIGSPDALIIRNADLRKCRFLGTDMRSVELTDVVWPMIAVGFGANRVGVYDEVDTLGEAKELPRGHLERLYRELKKNFESRGDHATAGDFHYGEKEMCRKNKKKTSLLHRFFLTIYWLISSYGERYLRPLICAVGILLSCSLGYLGFGMYAGEHRMSLLNPLDWLSAIWYGIQVMTLQKPEGWLIEGFAHHVRAIQGMLGPLILALFALALRQRLKR